jgi:NitT/TauT family transport system substrate-binding protein
MALQWLVQCKFAGYHCALENGYYRDEGIDLTIVCPGSL